MFTAMVPQGTGVQFGTGLPVTAEHVALRTLTSEGSVRVDAGVFTTVVAQQAIIRPGAGLEVLIDQEAFRALADVGILRVQTQLLTAVILLRAVIHSCVCHPGKHNIT